MGSKLKTQEQLDKANKKNVYDIVTDMILEKIESGVAPWVKPWNFYTPRNLVTNKDYRGINNTILSMCAGDTGIFATFKQLKDKGLQVNKGAKSIPVVFHLFREDEDNPDKTLYRGAKYYRVFRVEDTTAADNLGEMFDIEEFLPLPEDDRNAKIDSVLSEMVKGIGLKITNDQNSAFYSPSKHLINMPKYKNFKSSDGFYATFFHELVHSTSKDLNRNVGSHFGTKDYSFEELVAELGSAYLCQIYGVSNCEVDQPAAYIKGWASKFREDKKMIFKASSFAQNAVDHLLNKVNLVPF